MENAYFDFDHMYYKSVQYLKLNKIFRIIYTWLLM